MREGEGVGVGIKEFEDNSKNQLLKSVSHGRNFGRDRKNAELSSQPIFDLSQKYKFSKKLDYDTYFPCKTVQK